MPTVPLGTQAYSRQQASTPETRIVNLYMEEDLSGASPDQIMRLQRPGLARTATLKGAIRAIFQADNVAGSLPVIAAGGDLFTLDGDVTARIGWLPNDGNPVRIAATLLGTGFVSSGEFHVLTGTDIARIKRRSLEDASDGANTYDDIETVVDCEVLNGYFVIATTSGKYYWLVPGETTINPLNYATAEALPDGCLAVRRLRDDLFFFGSRSVEVWQSNGDPDQPFSRANGRLIDRGLLSRDSLCVFDNSLVWVGDNAIVYRMSDVPERISTYGIEERLRQRTGDPVAWTFTSFGHSFYVLRVPGAGTFAYDAATKLWSEFASEGATVWRPIGGTDTPTGTLCGDDDGGLFFLDPESSLDDGVPFLRLITGTIALPSKPFPNSSLSVGVGSSKPADFTLRWYDPRRGWSGEIVKASRGEGDILDFYRLGLAQAPSRTFEISTRAPVAVRISGALANEAWRV